MTTRHLLTPSVGLVRSVSKFLTIAFAVAGAAAMLLLFAVTGWFVLLVISTL